MIEIDPTVRAEMFLGSILNWGNEIAEKVGLKIMNGLEWQKKKEEAKDIIRTHTGLRFPEDVE